MIEPFAAAEGGDAYRGTPWDPHGADDEAPGSRDAPAVVNAFLLRFVEDQSRSTVRAVEDYQADFPGYEEVIAREYARLVHDEETVGVELGFETGFDADAPSVVSSPPVPDVPSERIGPYKLQSILGEGGMGVVYLAEQVTPIQRRVALKLIKLGMDTREVLARFETERQALALMDHPNIATVLDAGTTDYGRPYFVMEYVRGIPITLYCDKNQLDMRQRLALFCQVCEGIQHAHQKGIIHRDIKPSNILVTVDGDRALPKIIDFGVAKSTNQRFAEQTVFTHQGQVIGTPEYMSPEQADGSALDVDTRTDIYSLGVLLYELLIGALPFDSKALRRAGLAEIQRRIVEDEIPKPSTRFSGLGETSSHIARRRRTDVSGLLRELRGDLDWIAMRAMEKDRTRRYASASEFAADIQRHLRHEPVLAGPPSWTYRARKFVRKHRVPLGVAVAVVALLTGAIWTTLRAAEQREFSAKVRISGGKIDSAAASLASYALEKERVEELEAQLEESESTYRPWQPVWSSEVQQHLEIWQRLEEARAGAESAHNSAIVSLHEALQEAPPGSERAERARRQLERLYAEWYERSLRAGGLYQKPEYLRGLIQAFKLEGGLRALASGEVVVESQPSAARIYCFRYERHGNHLVPIAFDWRTGRSLGRPFLELDRVWRPELSPFRSGDRLLGVVGHERIEIERRADLVAILSRLREDEAITVKVRRRESTGEVERTVEWVPFPSTVDYDVPEESEEKVRYRLKRPLGRGDVLDFYFQFGFTFAGFPLEFHEEALIGVTPLRVELPRGSYLFVLKREGYADTRYPISVPQPEEKISVRLLRPDEIPEGFVYVPGGPFPYGGDSQVSFQNLEPGRDHVDGLFMSRYEVTFGDYLEFVNDREVFHDIDPETGEAPARAQPSWYFPELHTILDPSETQRVQIFPRLGRENMFELTEDGQRWKLRDRWRNLERKPGGLIEKTEEKALWGISLLAGMEYAHWKTKQMRKQYGKNWRVRLPTDLEWEKAARGADRRIFVWGNDPVWTYCRCARGNYLSGAAWGPVGAFPLDESVYGVRDMAGSVDEPVTAITLKLPGARFTARRGGNWYTYDDYYFRIPNRNGWVPTEHRREVGLRLVAELAP